MRSTRRSAARAEAVGSNRVDRIPSTGVKTEKLTSLRDVTGENVLTDAVGIWDVSSGAMAALWGLRRTTEGGARSAAGSGTEQDVEGQFSGPGRGGHAGANNARVCRAVQQRLGIGEGLGADRLETKA